MLQLRLLAGKNCGAVYDLRRFPYLVGRSTSMDLRLEDPGVWDRHLRLECVPGSGVTLRVLPGALASVNGQAAECIILQNGDIIEFGAVKMEFQLGPARQRGFRLRETLTWASFVVLCLGEALLIERLLR
jgi:hypothetical protein